VNGQTRRGIKLYEANPISGVFQNIYPPTPSPPSECVLPPHQRRGVGGTLSPGGEGGWGVNILEDARHWIGLLQFNPSTCRPIHFYKILDSILTLFASSPLLSFSFTLNHLHISFSHLLSSRPSFPPLLPPPAWRLFCILS
jgi:hypothetical protein